MMNKWVLLIALSFLIMVAFISSFIIKGDDWYLTKDQIGVNMLDVNKTEINDAFEEGVNGTVYVYKVTYDGKEKIGENFTVYFDVGGVPSGTAHFNVVTFEPIYETESAWWAIILFPVLTGVCIFGLLFGIEQFRAEKKKYCADCHKLLNTDERYLCNGCAERIRKSTISKCHDTKSPTHFALNTDEMDRIIEGGAITIDGIDSAVLKLTIRAGDYSEFKHRWASKKEGKDSEKECCECSRDIFPEMLRG